MPPLPPLPPRPLPGSENLPRIITYYQTHHDAEGRHISVLPLLREPGIGLTHLILAAVHVNADPNGLTLNDHAPSHPRFDTLWAELRVLQAAGIKVLALVGGAAAGTFARLDGRGEGGSGSGSFEAYYGPLQRLVRERGLDGVDLDVEEPMSLGGVVRLVDRLRADFGPQFLITMAPVAAALLDPRRNLSGFDYGALEAVRGPQIAWYNAQFYCGWGDCSNPLMYEALLARGWPPERFVVGVVTNPDNGSGWVPWDVLGNVVPLLAARIHPRRFGGVMGWEYFNSLPGGREKPWEWAQWMSALLGREPTMSESAPMGPTATLPAAAATGDAGADIEGLDGKTSGEAPLPASFDYYSDGLVGDDDDA